MTRFEFRWTDDKRRAWHVEAISARLALKAFRKKFGRDPDEFSEAHPAPFGIPAMELTPIPRDEW